MPRDPASDRFVPDPRRRYTAQEAIDFPADGKRWELVHGQLLATTDVTVGHQQILQDVELALREYLASVGRQDTVWHAPADIMWADDMLIKPDIFVVPPGPILEDWSSVDELLLAIEISSPETVEADRGVKRRAYLEHGVPCYWVIDPNTRTVEEWHPGDDAPRSVNGPLRWRASADLAECVIPIQDIITENARWVGVSVKEFFRRLLSGPPPTDG